MQYLKLVLAIAAALRAKDFKLALENLIALLQLVAGALPTPNPISIAAESGALAYHAVPADVVAAELEAFAKEYESQGATIQANGEFFKKLFALVLKLLPLILAGL